MKYYARQALNQYGRANYVLDDDRVRFDDTSDEIYIMQENLSDNNHDLVQRLARETFSLCGKLSPSKPPYAPAPSPRPIVTSRRIAFKVLPKSEVDKISERLTKSTFATKQRQKDTSPEPKMHKCPKEKTAEARRTKMRQASPSRKGYTPRTDTPRSKTNTPRASVTPRPGRSSVDSKISRKS